MAGESNKLGNHRHTLMMLLGCLAPLAVIMVLWFAGVSQSILTFGIILLCPVMHFIMMKNMKHENVENENMKHGAQSIKSNSGSKMDSENKKEELA